MTGQGTIREINIPGFSGTITEINSPCLIRESPRKLTTLAYQEPSALAYHGSKHLFLIREVNSLIRPGNHQENKQPCLIREPSGK
jgi:hypothetical protein